MNWEINRNLRIGIAVSVTIILTINLLSFTSIRHLITANNWVDHTHEVIQKLQSLLVRMINIDTSSRGFLITGEQRFLEHYDSSRPYVDDDLKDLRKLTLDNPVQLKRIDSFEVEMQKFLGLVDRAIENRKVEALQDQEILAHLRNQKAIVDSLRKQIEVMQSEEKGLLAVRNQEETKKATQTNVFIITGTTIAILLLLIVLFLLNREMVGRKKEEELRKAAEERVRMAVTGAGVGTWHWDLKTNTIEWSDEFRKMCNIDKSTLASVQSFMDAIHPDDRQSVRERSQLVIEGDPSMNTNTSEYRIIDRDGSIRYITTMGRIYRDDHGKPLRMEGIGQDVTARKEAEQEIHQLNVELEKKIAQASELNQELEAFTYSVSHDLRAPLRHINGFVELLRKNEASGLNEKSQHYLNVISEAATSMGKLIDDLLALSRTGRSEIKKHRVDLNIMISDLQKRFESETTGRKIEWKIGKLPQVFADPNLMKIVLDNLISNSLKYTRPREVAEIQIGSITNETHSEVFVKDNGVGFDMKYADKLFGAFQRLHRAEEFEGTGVGLATVRRILNRHNGKVWAESQKGVGSTFYFSLPKD